MTPRDFVHYLSGAIELGNIKQLSPEHFQIIANQLNQINIDSNKESQFCLWLQGVIDLSENHELSIKQFEKVTQKLQGCLDNKTRTRVQRTHYNIDDVDAHLAGAIAKC